MKTKQNIYGLTYLEKINQNNHTVNNDITGCRALFTELKTCLARCLPDGTCVIECDTIIVGPLD